MKGHEFSERLRRAGVVIIESRGKSGHVLALQGNKQATVPCHGDADLGHVFMKKIIKQLGLDPQEVLQAETVMSLKYPVTFTPDENGTIIAKFPDIPGALTVGQDEANALEWAQDTLLVTLSGIIVRRRAIPLPSPASPGQSVVEVPPMAEAKLTIYQATLDQGVSQLKMASLLLTDAKQIRRLLNLDHHSRFDQIEMALAVLGFQLALDIRRAA